MGVYYDKLSLAEYVVTRVTYWVIPQWPTPTRLWRAGVFYFYVQYSGNSVTKQGDSKMELPSIKNYGRYSSDNAHTLCISMLGIDIYFSYKTPVAFRAPSCGLVVHQNDWGPTTGKHLNFINPEKKGRVDDLRFNQLWAEHVEAQLSGVFLEAWKEANCQALKRNCP